VRSADPCSIRPLDGWEQTVVFDPGRRLWVGYAARGQTVIEVTGQTRAQATAVLWRAMQPETARIYRRRLSAMER